ncbi:MAG: DNA-binding protein [Deltaproteobacteria bacterium]|nr:DNA-binding protein [Deltaproteobacteria bacterium]
MTCSEINRQIAERMRETAELLAAQGANPFRIGAYRRAAATLEAAEQDVGAVFAARGVDGLMALPGVGESIAAAIRELVLTGRWSQLERLRGTLDPTTVFRAIPGVGPALARRLHDALHVDTLEALEAAVHEGRLGSIPGFGPRRVAVVRAGLASLLDRVRSRPRPPAGGALAEPAVEFLLDVDRQYRELAERGLLPTIAPRRLNPAGRAWLPILHTERGPWHFTAIFSNTARAHELGRTHDWVLLYFYDGEHREGQRTVVTETTGLLAGERVVRGREQECKDRHVHRPPAPVADPGHAG